MVRLDRAISLSEIENNACDTNARKH